MPKQAGRVWKIRPDIEAAIFSGVFFVLAMFCLKSICVCVVVEITKVARQEKPGKLGLAWMPPVAERDHWPEK